MANEQLLKDIAKIYGQDAVANLNTTPTQATQTQSPKMKKEDILNIYNSFANPSNSTTSQEIPQLQPNTLPDTNILRNNLLDRNSGRTDGETKALEDYLMSVENLKEQTYKQNYNSTIDDLKNQLADTNAQRTEGETKAIEEYLSGLQGLQSEIDRVNAPKNVKKNVLNNTVNSKKENIKKEDTVKDEQKARIEALKEKYGAQAKAQNDSLSAHGYSLSPNEQRDYDRAQEAIKNAQAKLVSQQKEVLANGQNQVNNGGELKVSTLTKNPTKTKLNLTSPTADNSNVEGGGSGASKSFANEEVEEKTGIDKWLDPSYKLSKQEKKEAKQLIKDYDAKEFNRNKAINEMPTNLSANEQRDYLRGNNAYEPTDSAEAEQINQLRNKVNGANALANGLMEVTPGTNIVSALQTMLNKDNAKVFEEDKAEREQANTQNPLAYYGGLLGGGLAYSLGGQGLLKGTKYGEAISKLTGDNASVGKKILGDALLDAPIDLATDTIPELLQNIATGSEDTKKDLAINLALNGALNLGASSLGNLDEIKNALKKTDNVIPSVGDNVIGNAIKQTDDAVQNVENLGKQILNANDNPIKVGKYTEIKYPYNGEVPSQTLTERNRISIPKENLDDAITNIGNAEIDSKLEGKSSKKILTKVYETLFGNDKTSFDVNVDGAKFNNSDYSVTVNKNAIGKICSDPNMSAEKLAVIDNLNEVIKNSEYVGSGKYVDYKNTGTNKKVIRYDYFETDAKINGQDYVVTFDVEVVPGRNNYRTHKVINEINLTPSSGETGPVPAAHEVKSGLFNSDIPNPIDNVNSNLSEANPIEETLTKEFPTEQTPEMRARQNAETVSNIVNPKELTNVDTETQKADIRSMLDGIDMDDTTRAEVSKQLDEVDTILDDFNNAQTKDEVISVMDRLENAYKNIDNSMKGKATVSELVDSGNLDAKKQLANAIKGNVIRLSDNSRGEFTDSTMKELNNILFNGKGSGRFSMSTGTPIDSVFGEIDDATGKAISSFMMQNGIDPSVSENQAKGIIEYAKSLKASDNALKQTQEVGSRELLGDTFSDMIDKAGKRGIDIDENELRKRMKISDFRTHNQGQFGLTDEELNNSYFNSQNEHFRFLKGDRTQDEANAIKNLNEDYEGTVNKILNKPTTEQFTPQEVDEGMMSWFKELDNSRETGDYNNAAEIMYRMTQDAHDKGSGLQAYVKWKQNSPAGVVLDANTKARDIAEDKLGKKYVSDVDNIIKEVKKLTDSGKSYEEMYEELKKLFSEVSDKGYKNGLNGFEQMDELIKSAKNVDGVTIKDIMYAANDIPNLDVNAQKEISEIAQEMFGKELTEAEKQSYINKINIILSNQKDWSIKDKAIEVAHIMMLSGFKTQEKNFLANVGMLPTSALARKISALGQGAYHLFNPNFKPTQSFFVNKESVELAKRALDNVGGVNAVAEGVTDKFSGKLAKGIGANYMFTGNGKRNVVARANDKLTNSIPKLGDFENKFSETLNKGLSKIGADGAYSQMNGDVSTFENFRQFIYGSMGGLEDNPFVKKNFEDRMASFIAARKIKNLNDIPQEAYDIATAEALKSTFKDDNAITKLFKSIKDIPIIGETELPYVKTPANLLARSIDYSPIGIARELYGMINKNSKFTRDTMSEAIDELSKGVSGTILAALGTYLYANGVFTGAKNEDKDIANYMVGEGWSPYSISSKGLADFINNKLGTNIDLGDTYKDWSWLQPSTTNWIAGIALWDELNDGTSITDKSADEIFSKARSIVGSYVDTLLNQSTLQDVGSLFDTTYGNNVGENLIDNVIETPTRFFSGALYDATKIADDTKREYYSKGKPLETTMNLAMSKIPFVSKTLPAKHDVWGDEVTRTPEGGNRVVNTLFDVSNTNHMSDNELYQLVDNVNANATTESYIPKTAERSFKTIEDGVETKKNLDNKEYSELTEKYGNTRANLIEKVANTEAFKNYDADSQALIMNEFDSVAEAVGKLAVDPNAKISDDTQKLLDKYNENEDAFIEDTIKKYNPNVVAAKKAKNNPGEYEDGSKMSQADSVLEYLDTTELTEEEKGEVLFNTLTENKTTSELAEKDDFKGVYNFYTDKSELKRYANTNKNTNTNTATTSVSDEEKLKSLGMNGKYANEAWSKAHHIIPTLTIEQFSNTYKAIDSSVKEPNNAISQEEIIAYLNDGSYSEEQGMEIWNAYGTSTWKKVPYLGDNGEWSLAKK